MCELLAMSAAPAAVPRDHASPFEETAPAGLTGWGLGFFRSGEALVEKSPPRGEPPYDSLRRLSRVVESPVILAHLRGPKSGGPPGAQVQPLRDHFLDHDWLFTFMGESRKIENYKSPRPLMDRECRAARVFEFIRDGLTAGLAGTPHDSLFQVLAVTVRDLITAYPGKYIFFLAHAGVVLAFLNHSQVHFRRLPGSSGGSGLLRAHQKQRINYPEQWITSEERQWVSFASPDPSQGLIIMVSGADLIYVGQV